MEGERAGERPSLNRQHSDLDIGRDFLPLERSQTVLEHLVVVEEREIDGRGGFAVVESD